MKKYGAYEAVRGIVQLDKLNGKVICKHNDPITALTIGKNKHKDDEESTLVVLEYDTETKELKQLKFSELDRHMNQIKKDGINAGMLIDEPDRNKPVEYALVGYKLRGEEQNKMSVIMTDKNLGAIVGFTHQIIKELPLEPEAKLVLIMEMAEMLKDVMRDIVPKIEQELKEKIKRKDIQ